MNNSYMWVGVMNNSEVFLDQCVHSAYGGGYCGQLCTYTCGVVEVVSGVLM